MTSFDDRFQELWSLAYRVAYRVLGDREPCRDVAQETLVRIARGWQRFEPCARAMTAKIAGDRAIDQWRRRKRTVAGPVREQVAREAGVEERAELVEALRLLPVRQRETVVLRYLADLSEADTARALGCSEGTVKTHASRGLAALRKTLTLSEAGG